ncbi:uncharacterized protein TrAFT101_011566 [Trichoderma asperellum]|uniref:uncharacterized protein n=1 Tax=Trichoderma asperellum TaxID=101201 RepID=UPI003322E386|nr:hypothetical protein TrAFT101_011566 [Trichoderma asperellum]
MEPPRLLPERCVIISAFVASGKTWLTTNSKNLGLSGFNVLDLDSSVIPKENGQRASNFKELYMAKVRESIAPNTIVLISTHEEIRSALVEEGLNYALVYPVRDLKGEWIRRLRSRKSPEGLIDIVHKDWSSMLDECENQGGCSHYALEKGLYLSDMIGNIMEGMLPGTC